MQCARYGSDDATEHAHVDGMNVLISAVLERYVHELSSQVRSVIPYSVGRLISVLWIALQNIRSPNGGHSA